MTAPPDDAWLVRYQQQLLLPGLGVPGQRRLEAARVVVIGLGGLGCASTPYLAGAGIGELVLIDDDRVESANLPRQTLFTEADLGRAKTAVAQERLQAMNPAVRVHSVQERATDNNLTSLLEGANMVLDGSDNFATRYTINRACVRRGIALISGSAIGLRGQVAVLTARPCYACLYPPETQAPDENCSHGSVLGPLVGIVGALQASRALQHLTGMAGGESARLWSFDLAQHSPRAVTLVADPACPVCRQA